jgi:hypothetical protein
VNFLVAYPLIGEIFFPEKNSLFISGKFFGLKLAVEIFLNILFFPFFYWFFKKADRFISLYSNKKILAK